VAELPLSRNDVDYGNYDRAQAKVVLGVQPEPIARLARVHGLDDVKRLPSFLDLGMVRPVGTRVPKTIDLDSRAWEIYLLHPDPGQVAHDAEVARRLIRYE
jgi:hypothetical protein